MAEIDPLSDLRLEQINNVLLPPRGNSEPAVIRGEPLDQKQLPSPRQQPAPDVIGFQGRTYFELGNHDTGPFLNKMQHAVRQTSSMKNCCIEAARVSPARNQHERYDMKLFRQSIDEARGASKVARGVETDARQQLGSTPGELGHLTLFSRRPSIAGHRESPEFVLPGAVEAFRDPVERVEDDRRQWATGIRGCNGGIGFEAASAMETDVGSRCEEVQEKDGIPRVETDLAVQDEDAETLTDQPWNATSPLLACTQDASRSSSKFRLGSLGVSSTDTTTSSNTTYCGVPTENGKPSLRFKILAQFSERFNPSDSKGVVKAATKERQHAVAQTQAPDEEVHDSILGWVRHTFGIDIKTKKQLETGFPLIVLTALDAVYANRVKWTEVDWGLKYERATWKNVILMQQLWEEVSMDSSREFRPEATTLRLEAMFTARARERLDFLKLLRRWLIHRIPNSEPYDYMARRRQYVEQCQLWGKEVRFPNWILYEEQLTPSPNKSPLRPNSSYRKMPEFRRLSWFLGSHKYPSM